MNRPRAALAGAAALAVLVLAGWYSIRHSSMDSMSHPGGGMTMGTMTMSTMDHSGGAMPGMTPLVAGADGTKASAAGLTLEPRSAVVAPGVTTRWQLRVVERGGAVVRSFERDQQKLMHLIVVRSDLTGYQHLHPTLGRDGVFTVDLRLPKPGAYRAIADFTTGGKRYALGVPVKVTGKASDAPLPPATMEARTDGYSVMFRHAAINAGSDAELEFTVTRNGEPVTALLPYLGAYGHLVALKSPTLAYSHVHPTSEDRSSGTIRFSADFPTSGRYRLFLQFRTASGVHTAGFTVAAGG